jgi:hypothetical protein
MQTTGQLGVGLSLLDYVVKGTTINIAKKSGGNTIGKLSGVDDRFVYVTQTGGTHVIGVPWDNVGEFTIG